MRDAHLRNHWVDMSNYSFRFAYSWPNATVWCGPTSVPSYTNPFPIQTWERCGCPSSHPLHQVTMCLCHQVSITSNDSCNWHIHVPMGQQCVLARISVAVGEAALAPVDTLRAGVDVGIEAPGTTHKRYYWQASLFGIDAPEQRCPSLRVAQ